MYIYIYYRLMIWVCRYTLFLDLDPILLITTPVKHLLFSTGWLKPPLNIAPLHKLAHDFEGKGLTPKGGAGPRMCWELRLDTDYLLGTQISDYNL
jgi:hypothetical protein